MCFSMLHGGRRRGRRIAGGGRHTTARSVASVDAEPRSTGGKGENTPGFFKQLSHELHCGAACFVPFRWTRQQHPVRISATRPISTLVRRDGRRINMAGSHAAIALEMSYTPHPGASSLYDARLWVRRRRGKHGPPAIIGQIILPCANGL